MSERLPVTATFIGTNIGMLNIVQCRDIGHVREEGLRSGTGTGRARQASQLQLHARFTMRLDIRLVCLHTSPHCYTLAAR
jgi:hypothetical protein